MAETSDPTPSNDTTTTETTQSAESTRVESSTPEQSRIANEEPSSGYKSLRANLRANLKGDKQPEAKPTAEAKPAPQAAPVEPVLAPGDMSKEEREMWAKLDPSMQKYISRRSYELKSDWTRKSMELGQKERELQTFRETVAPYQEEWTKLGITPAQGIGRLAAWDKHLRAGGPAAAREFLEAYGYDPGQLLDVEASTQAQPQQQTFGPEQIEEIVQKRIEAYEQQKQQSTYTQGALDAVNSFIAKQPLLKDPNTADQITAAMAPILAAWRQTNPELSPSEALDRAYNMVLNGDPQFADLRTKIQAKENAERLKAEAAKAQQASRGISGGPGPGTPTRKFDNLRDNLRARLHGGA